MMAKSIFQNVRGILIDFDGTLVDSVPILYSVYESFLSQFGVKGSREEFVSLTGATFPEILKALNARYRLSQDDAHLREKYDALLHEFYINKIPLMDNAKECVELAKSQGYRLGVVTAARNHLVEAALQSKGIFHLFDAIISGEKLTKGKPDPEIYLKGLQALQLEPYEAVAIEDSSNGIQAALGAGISTIMISNESADNPSQSALKIVSSWSEIISLLKN